MDKPVFYKWGPLSDIPDELYLEGLYDDYEGFRLLLKGSGTQARMLRISFDSILAYRNIDEGDMLKGVDESEGLFKWSLFLVENSFFINWFHEQSYNIHMSEPIVNYAVYTPNDCIEILSAYPPNVEWLN